MQQVIEDGIKNAGPEMPNNKLIQVTLPVQFYVAMRDSQIQICWL
jgi:hypothetical protein